MRDPGMLQYLVQIQSYRLKARKSVSNEYLRSTKNIYKLSCAMEKMIKDVTNWEVYTVTFLNWTSEELRKVDQES